MSIFTKIKNYYYSMKVENFTKMRSIFEIPEETSDLGLFISPESKIPHMKPDTLYAFSSEDDTRFDYFINGFHFLIIRKKSKMLLQMYIAGPNLSWKIERNEKGNWDLSNVDNGAFEVYTWFDMETMLGRRCSDSRYLPGSWNRYVVTNLELLFKNIAQSHDSYKFNTLYGEKKEGATEEIALSE